MSNAITPAHLKNYTLEELGGHFDRLTRSVRDIDAEMRGLRDAKDRLVKRRAEVVDEARFRRFGVSPNDVLLEVSPQGRSKPVEGAFQGWIDPYFAETFDAMVGTDDHPPSVSVRLIKKNGEVGQVEKRFWRWARK